VNYDHLNRSFFYIAAAILIFTGCTSQIDKTIRLCPGKDSTDEALSILKSRSQYIVPFRATGQCFLRYHTEKHKLSKQNFPIKLWLNPPAEIYMQGDVAFDPRGVVVGSNENEFWLAIRLKDVSSYYWGTWTEANYVDELILSPKMLLEALGFAVIDSNEADQTNWSLLEENNFDVLANYDGRGRVLKKLYINRCDYLVQRIEYLDSAEQPMVIVEMEKYKQLANEFVVPTKIKIIKVTNGHRKDSVAITLNFIKPVSFTSKQQNRLFARPEQKGFKNIYRILYGEFVEQTQ
jgi:hypothetical protein